MPVVKSLSFTAMPKSASDPIHIRRAKFIDKLEEQKLLLQDPGYVRTVQRRPKWTVISRPSSATNGSGHGGRWFRPA